MPNDQMSPERAAQLYEAIQLLRDFRKEAALIAPMVAVEVPALGLGIGTAVALEPVAEAVLSLLFETVSAIEMYSNPEDQKRVVAEAIRARWIDQLKGRFPS